jgi:hypothetical protein
MRRSPDKDAEDPGKTMARKWNEATCAGPRWGNFGKALHTSIRHEIALGAEAVDFPP